MNFWSSSDLRCLFEKNIAEEVKKKVRSCMVGRWILGIGGWLVVTCKPSGLVL